MMAKLITMCLLFILSSLLTINFVAGERNGLTLKLIHRDSPESPLYQPNLTYSQQIERLINQSKARLELLSDFPSDLRSKVIIQGAILFLTQLGIGTFHSKNEPYKSYYFVVDVGSPLTWVECQDCKLPENHCIRPSSQPFPDRLSSSYKKLLCPTRGQSHLICKPSECIGKFCGYNSKYLDNSSSKGFLAHETFTFQAIAREQRTKKVSDLVFGCGFDIRNFVVQNSSNFAGLLGLGWGPKSFVTQLGSRSKGKFSYCLQRMTNITTFLHFGNNIPLTQARYSTPLRTYGTEGAYYVNLTGISVSATLLNLTAHDFARKHDGSGGCAMDSGSSVSHIAHFAYVKIKEGLIRYFNNVFGFERAESLGFDLCYKRRMPIQGFRDLPTITFHFPGAYLQLEPLNVFFQLTIDGKEGFCLAMFSNDGPSRLTVIGAYQQTNYRFIYLTREGILRFGPENCTENA